MTAISCFLDPFEMTRRVLRIAGVHQCYFENPFVSSVGQPRDDTTEYLENALTLMRDIDHHYSGVDLGRTSADLYVGTSGAAYSCFRLSSKTIPHSDKDMLDGLSSRLIESVLSKPQRKKDEGFLVGEPGRYVAGALVYKAAAQNSKAEECLQRYAKCCEGLDKLMVHESSGDELFSGRVGYLAGILELVKHFPNNQVLMDIDVKKIVGAVLESGRKYSRRRGLAQLSPLFFFHFSSDYVGAAHGASAILQLLMCYPNTLARLTDGEAHVRKSVDYLMQQQAANGNFPPQFGECIGDHELVHWCHGAPGVIYMLAKAWLMWKDKKYLQACERCVEIVWKKGLLRKGPGICHGIAGNGYVFLLMYRITGQPEYLYQAQCFADLMFQPDVQDKSRTPENPFSLFEGVAGTVCFLADLTDPQKAAFPFYDIFSDFA